jgi:tryprostatin B 6-hydroxylase
MHTIRRLVWKQGFTSKGWYSSYIACSCCGALRVVALRDGKDQTLSLIKQLDNCIQADIRTGRVSELSDFVYWFSFDRMASYVLGHSFNMLREQQWHYIIVLLQRALSILGPLSPTPWLVQLAFRLGPRVWVIHDWFTMMEWCGGQLKQYKV